MRNKISLRNVRNENVLRKSFGLIFSINEGSFPCWAHNRSIILQSVLHNMSDLQQTGKKRKVTKCILVLWWKNNEMAPCFRVQKCYLHRFRCSNIPAASLTEWVQERRALREEIIPGCHSKKPSLGVLTPLLHYCLHLWTAAICPDRFASICKYECT